MDKDKTSIANLSEAEKAYIKEIAREVVQELPCKPIEERVRKVEQKLTNGLNTKINILFGLYTIIIGRMIFEFFIK